jgi:hypothetical protein
LSKQGLARRLGLSVGTNKCDRSLDGLGLGQSALDCFALSDALLPGEETWKSLDVERLDDRPAIHGQLITSAMV